MEDMKQCTFTKEICEFINKSCRLLWPLAHQVGGKYRPDLGPDTLVWDEVIENIVNDTATPITTFVELAEAGRSMTINRYERYLELFRHLNEQGLRLNVTNTQIKIYKPTGQEGWKVEFDEGVKLYVNAFCRQLWSQASEQDGTYKPDPKISTLTWNKVIEYMPDIDLPDCKTSLSTLMSNSWYTYRSDAYCKLFERLDKEGKLQVKMTGKKIEISFRDVRESKHEKMRTLIFEQVMLDDNYPQEFVNCIAMTVWGSSCCFNEEELAAPSHNTHRWDWILKLATLHYKNGVYTFRDILSPMELYVAGTIPNSSDYVRLFRELADTELLLIAIHDSTISILWSPLAKKKSLLGTRSSQSEIEFAAVPSDRRQVAILYCSNEEDAAKIAEYLECCYIKSSTVLPWIVVGTQEQSDKYQAESMRALVDSQSRR